MISRKPRTGNQFTITHGDYKAVITELGAILRRYTYKDIDIIVPSEADEVIVCCKGQILAPFPNRLEDGIYTFDGKTYTLPIDEHDRNNAIHGYASRYYWTLERLVEDSITLSWRIPDMSGYPFDVTVEATYTLKDDGIHISISATNNGDEKAPWAMAMHPWLDNSLKGYGDEIDGHNAQCRLTIPAATHVTANDRLLPTGTESVESTKYDLRDDPFLTEQPFDDAWTDVEHDNNGLTTAVFTRADGKKVYLGGDSTITSFQVCTGTGFPADMHPAGVAVEPQTAYANAFNTGNELVTIEPHETFTSEVFIRAEFE